MSYHSGAFSGSQARLRLEDEALDMIESGKPRKEVRRFLGICESTLTLRMRVARNRRRWIDAFSRAVVRELNENHSPTR